MDQINFEQSVKLTCATLTNRDRNLQRYALLELLRQSPTWREGIVPARFLVGGRSNPTGVARALCRLHLARESGALRKGFRLTELGKAVAEKLKARERG